MLDPTTQLQPEPLMSPPAEADLVTQQRRQIMLARGLMAKMAASLSHSGGINGLLVKQLAQQGAERIDAQLRRNNAAQTQALTRFLQWTTRAVSASDCSDEQFIAEFAAAYDALDAAFPD